MDRADAGDRAPTTRGVLVVTTGRAPYLLGSLLSLAIQLTDRADRCVIVGDALPLSARLVLKALGRRIATELVVLEQPNSSQEANLVAGWGALKHLEVVLHVEEDFVLLRRVDLYTVGRILVEDETISQLLLTRQRWYRAEHAYPSVRDLLLATFAGAWQDDAINRRRAGAEVQLPVAFLQVRHLLPRQAFSQQVPSMQ